MRGVITTRGPDQEDYSASPHAQALQLKFTVALAIVFQRDHRVIENELQLSKINLVLADVFPSCSAHRPSINSHHHSPYPSAQLALGAQQHIVAWLLA